MPFPPKPSHAPSFTPLWKKPRKMIAAWPPLEAAGFYDVADTDNWGTAAGRNGLPDAWDLIIFNFRTDSPEEVNWYLNHIVGCIHSNDGKNFSFRGAEFRRI